MHQLSELGFIIVKIDGMGTSNHSKAFHDICRKNIKDAGFEDWILWIKTAAEKFPNVDPTSTMQVVNTLIRANKEFEYVFFPGAKHTSGGVYGERKRQDFFLKTLLGIEPPDWNMIEK
jgi:dipeptidyl aminopeptidase/acylaminoacyl peptidase